jgi:hypothetical protein
MDAVAGGQGRGWWTMGGALGAFLNDYVFPLLGLCLMALGAWSSWEIWRPRTASEAEAPPLGSRVAAIILGGVWGWLLCNLPHPQDTAHIAIGFPMPVMTLAKGSGRWLELDSRASMPCALLNLAIGIGMVDTVLHLLWKFRPKRRPRRRAGFFDAWRVPRAGTRGGPRRQPVSAPPFRRGRRASLIGAWPPVQGREGRRDLAEHGVEEPEALPAGQDGSRV